VYLLPRQKKRLRNFVDNLCTIFVNFLIIPRNSLILMLISYRDERAKNVHKFFIMLFFQLAKSAGTARLVVSP